MMFLLTSFQDVLGDIGSRMFPSLPAVLTQLVAFGIMVLIVITKFYQPIKDLIAKRKALVTAPQQASARDAEIAQAKLMESETILDQARREALQLKEEARVAAIQEKQSILDQAQREAQLRREQAERELAFQRTQAELEIHDQIVEVALAAAEKVVQREISSEDHTRLLQQFLKEVDTNG